MSVFQDILGVLSPVYSLITGKGPAGAVVEPVLNAVAPGVGTAVSKLAPKAPAAPSTSAPTQTIPANTFSGGSTPANDRGINNTTGGGSFLTWVENNIAAVVVSVIGFFLILVLIFRK